MEFYQSIHTFYDDIFPLNTMQLSFIEMNISQKSSMLDIGCGTGNLAIAMAAKGFVVDAIDLENEMIVMAKAKVKQGNPNFIAANMLDVGEIFGADKYSVVTCFGNTLVHLTRYNEVEQFLKGVFKVLKEDGKFLLQILNYDNILSNSITSLPLIDNERIKFVRNYQFHKNGFISFNTSLFIKNNKQTIENSILLKPVFVDELKNLLTKCGFRSVELYGGFNGESVNTKNLPLVISAQK
ncbi:MAG: class I SAM-dependent methyltransferase [Prolixibacteraceae bacterium]|nr:class I SAM-dependent methyltransferase [Prolixibacteraceae bacterium]